MAGRCRWFVGSAAALLTVVGVATSVAVAADVPVPPVSVPSVSVPSVPAPPVPVPSTPAVPVPAVGSSTGAGAGASASPAPATAVPPATQHAVRSAVQTAAGRLFGSGSSPSGSGQDQSLPLEDGNGSSQAPSAATGEAPGVSRRARVRRDRQLRRTVMRLDGCLEQVPARERRVLDLRAGVGIGHTRSRAEVARLTKVTPDGVRRLERRGLHRLRTLGRSGACSSGSGAGSVAGAVTAAVPLTTAAAGVGRATADRGASGSGRGGKPASSGSNRNRSQTKSAPSAGASSVPQYLLRKVGSADDSSAMIALGLALLVLLPVCFITVRDLRGRRVSPYDNS